MPTKSEIDDTELLALFANGDRNAFDTLYNTYWKVLYVIAIKALKSTEEAEDLVQNVFLSIWKRRENLNISTNIKAYLMMSIKYQVINHIQKNITKREYLSLLTDASLATMPADAEQNLSIKSLQDAVTSAIEKMSPKMRQAYQLSREEHLSHKEIGTKLGISPETVKKHIKFALQHIREEIAITNLPLATVLFTIVFGK